MMLINFGSNIFSFSFPPMPNSLVELTDRWKRESIDEANIARFTNELNSYTIHKYNLSGFQLIPERYVIENQENSERKEMLTGNVNIFHENMDSMLALAKGESI